MAIIKVHGNAVSTNVIRVIACLYKKGRFRRRSRRHVRRRHKKEPYLSLNPFGQVPAFEDGDLKLFGDLKKNSIMTVWSLIEALQFYTPASKFTWEIVIKTAFDMVTDDVAVKDLEGQLAKVLDVYVTRLAHSKYLGGDTFTLADLNHLPNIGYLMDTRVKKLFDSRPHVSAWCSDIQARLAWLKALAPRN